MDNFDLRKYLAENKLLKEGYSPEELWDEWRTQEIELTSPDLAEKDGLTSPSYKNLNSPSLYASFMRYVELVNEFPNENRENLALQAAEETEGEY